MVGWGATSEGGPSSQTLRQVEVDVLESRICRSSYGPSFDARKMVCAGRVQGGKDSCQVRGGGARRYRLVCVCFHPIICLSVSINT